MKYHKCVFVLIKALVAKIATFESDPQLYHLVVKIIGKMKHIEKESEIELGKDKQRQYLVPFADILLLTAKELNKPPSPIKEESPI